MRIGVLLSTQIQQLEQVSSVVDPTFSDVILFEYWKH
jgi:hypothetical protein